MSCWTSRSADNEASVRTDGSSLSTAAGDGGDNDEEELLRMEAREREKKREDSNPVRTANAKQSWKELLTQHFYFLFQAKLAPFRSSAQLQLRYPLAPVFRG